MKNDFIPYEQALALKGLGFHEPCYGWFDAGYLRFGCYESEHVTGCGDLPAPLYQQAFRFFREKHGLRHFIEYDNGHYNAVVQSSLVYHCETHEEAELACLNRLIILITPITNPQNPNQ